MAENSLLMRVRGNLKTVKAPNGGDIVSAGAIEGLSVGDDGVVRFVLNAERSGGDPEAILEKARKAAGRTIGVKRVSAVATAHRAAPPARSGHDNPLGLAPQHGAPQKGPSRAEQAGGALTGVRRVIAVASGKGGVGKSTIAANLAVAFARMGLKTGLMDADIYGPSLPTLFGLHDRPQMDGDKIVPVEAFGVKAMSIGLMVEPESALAWRGPMVMGAVRQLISDVAWGDLDILVIDTPPGTGDAHLTLAQSKILSGAVIVSTPQEMALADVRRGVELFRKVSVPIIGVIENMAWLEDASGGRTYLFGEAGARRAANDLSAPFLGELPIYADLRAACDDGRPLASTQPENPAVAAFDAIAEKIWRSLV
jgi:ATP-binding protein involved in chromosome partitioning